jgi:sulfane dehydrogenase subunit SoxC
MGKRVMLTDLYAAGGGLINRRQLLGGSGVAATALGVNSFGIIGEVRAERAVPDWLKIAGEEARSYGLPAEQEADVKRAVIQLYKELAPQYSFSGTPLHRLRGTITPSGLHFEVHHGGRPHLDPQQHRLMIHGLVEHPLQFDLAALEHPVQCK